MTQTTNHKPRATSRVPRFTLNPIIIKEMRGHMRGSRAFWILTGYLVGLGLLAYGLYRITLNVLNGRWGPEALPQSAFVGQVLFIGLALLEMLFVCFITPALTSGIVSGEVERRTYDMLLTTPLHSTSILWGKVVASLIYIQLLILAAIPLSSVVFLFGGVVLRDMIQVIGLMALTAITYGTLGAFFSALTQRTGRATVLSYVVILVLIFGSVFAWAVVGTIGGQVPPREILYPNPISALASAIVTTETVQNMYSLGSLTELIFLLGGRPDMLGIDSAISRPLWQYTVTIYLAATVVLYLLTTRLIKPVRRWQIGWRGTAVTLFVMIALGGGLWLVFGTDKGSTGWQNQLEPTMVPVMSVPVMPVVVGSVVEVPPPLADVPTPTPAPTPEPFDSDQHQATVQAYLEQNVFPAGEQVFCDMMILRVSSEPGAYAEILTWTYCRAFRVSDGDLVSGVGLNAPMNVSMYWSPDGGWQFSGYWSGSVRDVLPPDVQAMVLEAPYDEALGEQQVRERARQALLGDQ
jgi:ABC-2 type transport system permease protein